MFIIFFFFLCNCYTTKCIYTRYSIETLLHYICHGFCMDDRRVIRAPLRSIEGSALNAPRSLDPPASATGLAYTLVRVHFISYYYACILRRWTFNLTNAPVFRNILQIVLLIVKRKRTFAIEKFINLLYTMCSLNIILYYVYTYILYS